MEIFGCAWDHLLKSGKYIIPAIVYTKCYLEERQAIELWEGMLVYNQTIAQSAKSELPSGRVSMARVAALDVMADRPAFQTRAKVEQEIPPPGPRNDSTP